MPEPLVPGHVDVEVEKREPTLGIGICNEGWVRLSSCVRTIGSNLPVLFTGLRRVAASFAPAGIGVLFGSAEDRADVVLAFVGLAEVIVIGVAVHPVVLLELAGDVVASEMFQLFSSVWLQ